MKIPSSGLSHVIHDWKYFRSIGKTIGNIFDRFGNISDCDFLFCKGMIPFDSNRTTSTCHSSGQSVFFPPHQDFVTIRSNKLERASKKHFPLQIGSLEIAYVICLCAIPNFCKLFASYRFTRENAFLKLLEAFLNLEELRKSIPPCK